VPRAGLSRERVVELALEVLDADGWSGLTVAAVAARAGVAVPSLYKHVGGLDDLRREVALVSVRDFGSGLRAARGEAQHRVAGAASEGPADARTAQARAVAAAVRAYGREHPGRYAAVQGGDWAHGPQAQALDAAGAEVLATIAASLAPLGLPEAGTVDAIRAVRALVHGFVALQASGGFGMPDDVDASFSGAVDALLAGLGEQRTR
jgi:AcrR family transcriptional regulator